MWVISMSKRTRLVSASLIASNLLDLQRDIERLERGGVDSLHLDVTDGHFVPILNMGDSLIKVIASTTLLPVEVHLAVANVDSALPRFLEYEVDCIYIHPETTAIPYRQLSAIAEAGKTPGIAVAPSYPLEGIFQLLDYVDVSPRVLIMSVEPGFGGQRFLFPALDKIKQIRAKYVNEIWVDGGIDLSTVEDVWRAGADAVVSGSFLLSASDDQLADRIQLLKKLP